MKMKLHYSFQPTIAFVFSSLLFLSGFVSDAATVKSQHPKKCEVFRPFMIDARPFSWTDVNQLADMHYGQKTKNTHQYWDALSDRENNCIYVKTQENGQVVFKTDSECKLGLGEPVRIAKIENGWALVYKEPKEVRYPKISIDAVFLGWIPMSHLLLWNSAPTDDSVLPSPVILTANIDVSLKNTLGFRYGNPDAIESGNPINMDMKDWCFRFIVKRVGTLSLLSESSTVSGSGDLYGWVDQNSYLPLGHLFIEPTWVVADVEYFAQNGITASIYDKENMKDRVSWISFEKKKTSNSFDPYMYRMAGNEFRYPVIDGFNGSSFWTMFIISSPGPADVLFAVSDLLSRNSQLGSEYPVLDSKWLEARIGQDAMASLKSNSFSVSYKSYVPKCDATNREFFKLVMLLSEGELSELLSKLEPFYGKQKNEKVIGEIAEILHSYGLDQVSVFSMDSPSVKDFDNRYVKLKEIRDGAYPFVYNRNNSVYYWIPIDSLP